MTQMETTKKAFITYVVEQSLFEVGGNQLFQDVSDKILEKYGCNIAECYKHPNYLNDTLDVIYRKSHKNIIDSIRIKIDDFVELESITDFLTKLK